MIKSIADNYRNVCGIAGASILGDGRVSLILDPPTLIEMSYHPHLAMAAPWRTLHDAYRLFGHGKNAPAEGSLRLGHP